MSSITREEINNNPYGTISINYESKAPSIMVLGYVNFENELQYMSSNDLSIVTRFGRIIKTIGFTEDLVDTIFVGSDPLEDKPHLIKNSVKYTRIVSFGGDVPWQGNLQCEVVNEGPELITVVELDFETIRLVEECKGVKWWRVKNTFWVDAYSGLVWKSYQILFTKEPRIELNTLKPLG